jgi:hypothetical protein
MLRRLLNMISEPDSQKTRNDVQDGILLGRQPDPNAGVHIAIGTLTQIVPGTTPLPDAYVFCQWGNVLAKMSDDETIAVGTQVWVMKSGNYYVVVGPYRP